MTAPDVAAKLRDGGVEPWLVEAVQRLARTDGRSLDPYLVTVGEATALAETFATCRCHFVRVDPQGAARVPALINMLTDQVVDYCIPEAASTKPASEHLQQSRCPA